MLRKQNRRLVSLLAFCLTLGCALPTAADWLVMTEGEMIETQGPWKIVGKTLTYTDLEGKEQTLPLTEVDLEGSEATTAFRQGRAYAPPPKAAVAASTRKEGEPQIILYETSWCGYCRKTRKLLDKLGVEYLAKDIEKDKQAAFEHRDKGKGSQGVPLIDFDGEIVRGYNEWQIRQLVEKLEAKDTPASP